MKILQPLKQRDFALLASAWTASLLGDGFFQVALAWQAYSISNVPTALGVIGFAQSLAIVLFALVGGYASDRFDRRRVMIAADLLRGAAIGAMGVLSLLGLIEIWHLVVLGFLVGAGDIFFNPASTSLVPQLVREDQLPQANAFRGAVRPLMMGLLGPALGGFAVSVAGPAPAFLIDAGTFFLSAVAVAFIRADTGPGLARAGLRESVRQVGEGLRFTRNTRWLWISLLSGTLSLIFFQGPMQVLVPYVIKNELGGGADSLGLIYAAGGAGAVLMSLAVGQYGLPKRPVTALYVIFAVSVAGISLYGLMTTLWQGIIASIVVQASFTWAMIIWITLLQRCIPAEMLGRVSSLDWLFSSALVPLSYAATGPIADAYGARNALLVAGVLGGVISFVLIFMPGARDPEVTGPFASARKAPV